MPINFLGLSPEASAAIVGAVAGGGIALVAQWLTGGVGALVNRRRAAQLIFAELLGNLANAIPATNPDYGWSSSKAEALRTAWDTYGIRLLLPGHHVHDIGAIASADNRVDDIAWLATTGGS